MSGDDTKPFSITLYRFQNGIVLVLSDGLSIALGLFIAGLLRQRIWEVPFLPMWAWYLFPLWWGGAILMRLVPSWGLGPVEELRRMSILQMFVHITTLVALFAGQQTPVAFASLFIIFCITSLCIPLFRIRIKRFLISIGKWGVPVVVYGTGEVACSVVELLQKEKGLGYIPLALIADDPGSAGIQSRSLTVPVHPPSYLACVRAPIVIVALPAIGHERLVSLLDGPLSRFYRVMVIPELFEVPSLWVKPRDIAGILGLEITSNLLSPFARMTKRFIELFLVLATAPFWIILCGCVTGMIALFERGTPFFLQDRVGRGGHRFRTFKFRTMVPHAEAVLQESLNADPELKKEWESTHKLKNDPRITTIGRFLRRFSIDELPQLLNVLQGDMSLVGPRPLPAYHHLTLSPRVRELRERVRPGLTGLWQVSGRSDRIDEMERMDSYYVRNWSPWLDMVILVRTIRAVFQGHGAY